MKNSVLLLSILCLFTGTFLPAQTADEAAIKEVCHKFQEAFSQRDFDTWQSYWHPTDQASLLSPHEGWNLQGWTAIREKMKPLFAEIQEPAIFTFLQTNHIIHVEGERAFVQFEQSNVHPRQVAGETFMPKYYEVRRLLKVDGQWKIHNAISTMKAEEMRSTDVILHLMMAANALNQLDRTEEALQMGAMINEFFPDSPCGYLVMAHVATRQQDHAKAVQYFKKAQALKDVDH